MQESVPQRLS